MKSSPLKIVVIYLIAGLCWIFVSDKALIYFGGATAAHVLLRHEMFKGFLYVIITGLLLYFLITHYFKVLGQSQVAYRKLFEENPCPMFAFDPGTFRFLAVNDACVAQYGYGREALLSMTYMDICHSCDAAKLQQLIHSGRLQGQNTEVWRHLTKEGKQLFVQITVHNTAIRGRQALWVQVRDITEATQNESLLTEAMERYDLVSKATNDLIWDWDAATGKVSVNTAAKKMFQYDLEEIKRSTYRQLIHPQDFVKVFNTMKRTLAEGRDTWTADYRIKSGKGNYRYVSSRAYILYDQEKRVRRVTGIVQDVTGIKNNALRLQEALERYDLTVKATHDIIWDWSAATRKVIVKGPLEENFGYDVSEVDKDWFFDRLHPDDQAGLKAGIISANIKRDPFWAQEFRLKCGDGTYKYVNNRAYIIYDDGGQAIRATGVIQVIQQQKEYETKIEAQNVLLKEIAQICSHELRGPVASIRGLLVLLNGDQVGEGENKKVFHYLDHAALKLDTVIHRVVEKANHVYYKME